MTHQLPQFESACEPFFSLLSTFGTSNLGEKMKNLKDVPQGYRVSRSFSPAHEHLLQVAFGQKVVAPVSRFKPLGDFLDVNKLKKLRHMLELEFLGGLEQELQQQPDPADGSPEPKAYDIFLMKPTSKCAVAQGRTVRLAVVMPLDSKKGPSLMMWCDGEKLWDLKSRTHVRRVGSLSGAARTLGAIRHGDPPSLMKWAMGRKELRDTMAHEEVQRFSRDHPQHVQSMNDSQVMAVATVANQKFEEGFFALQGPPGCGKTHTIVGMISTIGDGMIVTAPSNAAVANIAIKLFATGRYDLSEVTVYGDNCHESVKFLNPKLRSNKYRDFRRSYSDADGNDAKRARLLSSFAKWLHVNEQEGVTHAQVKKLCPYIDMEKAEDRIRLQRMIKKSKVIFCTLNTAGSYFLRKAVKDAKFKTFLLDEGGQSAEAEFYIATTFPGIKRVIVIGDPKQLPATVIEPVCKNAGYGHSWLGNVHKLFPNKVHLLDTQYRMDPSILAFPNTRFYDSRVKSGENVSQRVPRISHPVQFVDTSGGGAEEEADLSWTNRFEASVIKLVLQEDEDIIRIRKEVHEPRTIVITPYKAQVKLLGSTLATAKDIGTFEVATVDSFQGQEGDIVVVSTVRTRSVGFTDDPQRLNVALTRAKRVLRVVGSMDFFMSLNAKDSTLRSLAADAELRGVVMKKYVPSTSSGTDVVVVPTRKNRRRRFYGP